jgi:hypothetical protein
LKSVLVHGGFLGALLLCLFTIFLTQASSPDYKGLWRVAAMMAGLQILLSAASGVFLRLKPRLVLALATFLTLLAMLEMTLRVWFRIRLI